MEQIIMVKTDGSTYPLASKRTATKISSAKQTMQLLGDDVVNINVESPFPQTYAIGDYTTIFGRVYKLNQLPKVKKSGMRDFTYDITLEGIQYDLLRIAFELNINTTTNILQDVQGDALTGDLHMFATVLFANANRVFPGKWVLGSCPDTETKTLTFSENDNCLSVMQSLCQESNFNCEYQIEQDNGVNTVNFVEKVGQVFPYTFEFGRGKGLYSLDRQNVSSSSIVTRLFVFGSSNNITSKYRAKRLCLPGKSKAQSFIEDANAIAKYGVIEGKKYMDEVKPTFKGSITSLVSGSVLEFVDTKLFDLNALESDGKTTKYLIDGVTAKIHFNTGNLAGYEFEVAKYDHATHTITLKKQTDDRGDVFPSASSAAFQFAKGNEYKILDVALPESYEQDAEAELQEKGTVYYNQNSQPKVKYGLNVTKSFLEKKFGSDGTIVNVFMPGDYIPIKDVDIDVDKSVRIQSLVRDLLDEYNYTLTISDTITTTTINRVISDLIDIDKIININDLKDPAKARANWRSSREVLDMVFDPDGDYYSDKIKPNSIDTMSLSVGAKSMQFGLQNSIIEANYKCNANVVKVVGGVLSHYAIEDNIRMWTLANNTTTLDSSDAYYIYAKCSRLNADGSIIFSKQAVKVEEDANNYHFLIGVLNSVDKTLNVRSIYLQYGFTMINGRFIKTGRIESADGKTYFDLDKSEIGGRIAFTKNGKKQILDEMDFDDVQTVIDGGLVTTGTIQVGDKTNSRAGITGDGTKDESIRFFAGKKFTERGTAPFRVQDDGKVHMENAVVKGEIFATSGSFTGKVNANDGIFHGSIATPPIAIVDDSTQLNLSFDSGFNFAGSLYSTSSKTIKLPTDIKYSGVECTIINYGTQSNGFYNIQTEDNSNFLYSGTSTNVNVFGTIKLYGCSQLVMKAILINSTTLRWFVVNPNEFSFDYVNMCLTNNLPNQIARCIGAYQMTSNDNMQTISCADGNQITMNKRASGRWTFTFNKTRQSNKSYAVIVNGSTDIYVPMIHDKTNSSFQIDLLYWVLGSYNYGDIGNWGFMIFEFDI